MKITAKVPNNYLKIDNFLSRSAQPTLRDIKWLKEKGVTDVLSFRTMVTPKIDFDEKAVVQANGMTFHSIPSCSKYPESRNVGRFLDVVEEVKHKKGQLHIHCMQGADRTGMYSYIYERLNKIGTVADNVTELIAHGWHQKKYPQMIEWAENFVKEFANKFKK